MWSNRIILGTSPFTAFSLSLSHYLNGCISNPSPNQHHTTQNKRFTHHTHVYLHHPKKTHSMKWSDWMSTTCKVDKKYKTKINELCVVFVCSRMSLSPRFYTHFFTSNSYFTSVLCTFCCLLSILRHRPKHTNNVNKFHQLSSQW